MAERETRAPEPVQEKPELSAGQKLSEARISWGLSVEDVAENLNLSITSVEALERDDYECLPGYTFAKGYLRSYASLLRLDPDDVLASVDLVPEELLEIVAPKSMAKSMSRRNRRNRRKRRNVQRRKSGGRVLKRIVYTVVFLVLVLVGMDQFSKLDIDKIVESLNLSAFMDLVETDGDAN